MTYGNFIRRGISCEGKARFGSYGRAARLAHRQAQNKDAAFEAYPCKYCGGFHIGAVNGAPRQHVDSRLPFMVYARDENGREILAGWSATPDGGKTAQHITTTQGWTVSRIVERQGRQP